MTYNEMVKDVFIEHHNCMGMDMEEITDMMEEITIKRMEKFLTRIGYDLQELFENLF